MFKSISYETFLSNLSIVKLYCFHNYMVDSRKKCYLTQMNNVRKQNKVFRNKILFAI
jgi:hypothetical protein